MTLAVERQLILSMKTLEGSLVVGGSGRNVPVLGECRRP